MSRPTRYFVEYEDIIEYERLRKLRGQDDIDPADYVAERDFTSFEAARKFASGLRGWALLKQRKNIRDRTPLGDPPGLLWDYDEETIHPTELRTP